MAFSFRQRPNLQECARQVTLSSYVPSVLMEGLQPGIDNLRYDVVLSETFKEVARNHLARLIAKYGEVEDLTLQAWTTGSLTNGQRPTAPGEKKATADIPEFKSALASLHVSSLNRAKAICNVSLDVLARAAVIKFLRNELSAQFNRLLDRCRAKLKSYDRPGQTNATATIALRERVSRFQLGKTTILRKAAQEILQTLREVERETLAGTRHSLFGGNGNAGHDVLDNRLLFTKDGRDDFVNAEYYIMLGNFDRDPDRLGPMLEIAREFLRSLDVVPEDGAAAAMDAMLSAPENARELVGCGTPDVTMEKGRAQQAMLDAWTDLLDREGIMDHVIAAYESALLLGEYCPPVNPQQLKQALIWRDERKRVEHLLEQHGRFSTANLAAAIRRVAGCHGVERNRIAGRFLKDLMRYFRDMRKLETALTVLDSVNLLESTKLRELSAINHSLYEFLLPEEQKPATSEIKHHIVLKADIRDSSLLTRTLFERGLNPASYFSLNFYEPINRLLPKYDAKKLFIEGDAIILALFEREGESQFGVARTCVLAREIIEIVRGYNTKSQQAGLPTLELGIGICYQDSAPMYLMNESQQIMISPALNESDRLSSCNKSARKLITGAESLFNVYCFQTIDDADTAGQPEEFLMRYNLGGINLSDAGFRKLRQEISLEMHECSLPSLWNEGAVRLYAGVVPVGSGAFHDIVIRESRIPHIEPRDFQLKKWTDRHYYEVCTNDAIYDFVKNLRAKAATSY